MIDKSIIDSFKANCPQEIAYILNSSYIIASEFYNTFNFNKKASYSCEIYLNIKLTKQLRVNRRQLKLIGKKVGINSLKIIQISPQYLNRIKRQAIKRNNLYLWKHYLNLLYIL